MPHFAFAVTPQFARLFHWFALLIYCVYGARYFYRGLRFVRPRLTYLSILKRTHLQWRAAELAYHPCDLATVEALRQKKIALITRRVESTGFVHLGDYVFHEVAVSALLHAPPTPPLPAPGAAANDSQRRYYSVSYKRIFTHPTHGCLGNISYTVHKDARRPEWIHIRFSIDIYSISGHGEQDWLFHAALKDAEKLRVPSLLLFRRPRHLGIAMTKAKMSELLEKHLQRRAEIARVAGISWCRDLSMRDFITIHEKSIAYIRRASWQLTFTQLLWRLFLLNREVKKEGDNGEWLGELRGRL